MKCISPIHWTSLTVKGLAKHQPNTPSNAISIDVFPDPLQTMTTSYNLNKMKNSRRSDDQINTVTFEQLLAIDMKPECPLGWG
jgi:hypothetical protein